MSMTVLVISTYYLSGGALAVWLMASEHIDPWLSLLMLPLLYLAHLCWKMIAGPSQKLPSLKCLVCGNEISAFRRLGNHRFCSNKHEQMYLAELEQLAIERLVSAMGRAPALNQGTRTTVVEEDQAKAADCTLLFAQEPTGA
jgi:hypothetical protein